MKRVTHASERLAIEPTYAPLVPACAQHGVGRTKAFELARDGWLDTFRIGQRTFVRLDSLRTLPDRLALAELEVRGVKVAEHAANDGGRAE